MDAKNQYAVLLADVALYEDRGERIKRLEEENDAMRADLLFDTYPQTIVRELNRMADRIKRLEEAGDDLYANCDLSRWDSTATTARKLSDQNAWRKAKEDKL